MTDDKTTALIPIGDALPALRAERFAKVREWDAARMALEGEFEAADGEYLIKIRDELKPLKMWHSYLEARDIPIRTAQVRIQKAEGRYIAPRRADDARRTAIQPTPSWIAPVSVTIAPQEEPEPAEDDFWHGWTSQDVDGMDEGDEDDGWPPADQTIVEALPPASHQPAPLRESFSIADWQALTPDRREALIAGGHEGKAGLNEQKSDNIEWALWSWNPVTGCLHNCPYCYARDIANRFYPQGFAPTFLPSRLGAPYHQQVPAQAEHELGYRNIFTCSMADLFGKWVPAEWIQAVLDVARACPQWNFLFLTKFPNRLAEFTYPANAWLGTSVDCQARVKNAERSFAKVKGGVKWLSIEPMLEPLRFTSLDMFNWVVIGGASASSQTPEWHPPRRWVDDLEAQARDAGCMIYEKTNLQARLREYPGWQRQEATLPAALAYLPSIG